MGSDREGHMRPQGSRIEWISGWEARRIEVPRSIRNPSQASKVDPTKRNTLYWDGGITYMRIGGREAS